jgi:hypothetical protein
MARFKLNFQIQKNEVEICDNPTMKSLRSIRYQSCCLVASALLASSLVSSTFAFTPTTARIGGRKNAVTTGRPNFVTAAAVAPPHSSLLVRSAMPLSIMQDAWIYSGLLIATIDSDVANIPENEFASVFAGGILVMFGGVFSALIVGFILEKRNLYANIVAESYAQGGDEEFWKSLSAEEKTKAQSLLAQLKESKEASSNSDNVASGSVISQSTVAVDTSEKPILANTSESTNVSAPAPIKEKKPMGMFSDYDD